MTKRRIIVVVGSQWGDEGKGKLVDALSQRTLSCARYNGGANAGHTLILQGKKLAFHLLPCGALNPSVTNLIGNGVVLHLPALATEINLLKSSVDIDIEKSLKISSRCHLTFKFHIAADTVYETAKVGTPQAIGTTRRGIGPSYAGKALRLSLRACDMLLPFQEFTDKYMEQFRFFSKAFDLHGFDFEAELAELKDVYIPRFRACVVDPVVCMDEIFSQPLPPAPSCDLLSQQWHMVIEGANAAMLDLSVGSYPYCTSSDCLVSGIGAGLSLPPREIECVIGVAKAYCTRVGEGPFPTEIFDEVGTFLQSRGQEYGASTGRLRRCGWLDIPMLRYTHAVNGFDYLMITKLDVLSGLDEIKIATSYIDSDGSHLPDRYFPANLNDLKHIKCEYKTFKGWSEDITTCRTFEELPTNAQLYIREIQRLIGVPISFVGVGPGRESTIAL